MDIDEDLDTHICLKCQKTIVGLDSYVVHKKSGCPSLQTLKPDVQKPLSDSVKSPLKTCVKESTPALKPAEPSGPLRSDDFFLSLELKSSRGKELKRTLVQNDGDPKNVKSESLPVDEIATSSGSEQKPTQHVGEVNEDGEFEYGEEDSNDDYCPPPGHTGGKWTPGMQPWLTDLLKQKSSNPESGKKKLRPTYKCQPCGVTFARNAGLISHLASTEHWLTSGGHPTHELLILDHVEALAPLAPFRCTICAFYFNHLEDLVAHWVKEEETHKARVGQHHQLVCVPCKFRCWTTEEMLRHLDNIAHESGVSCWNPVELTVTSELCCSKCDWMGGRQQALNSHMRWKHADNIHCPKCRIGFPDQDSLDQHNLLDEHVLKGYDCSLCPYVGQSKGYLTAHVSQEHPQEMIKSTLPKRGRPRLADAKKNKLDAEPKASDVERIEKEEREKVKLDETPNDDQSELQVLRKRDMRKDQWKDHTYFDATSEEEPEPIEDSTIKKEKLVQSTDENASKKRLSKVCAYCCEKFSKKQLLRKHVQEFHPENLLCCEPCCSTFVFPSDLEQHQKTRTHKLNSEGHLNPEGHQNADEDSLQLTEEFFCRHCAFRSTSKAGTIFHEMLHAVNTEETLDALGDPKIDVQEVACLEEDPVRNRATGKAEDTVVDIQLADGSKKPVAKKRKKKKAPAKFVKLISCPICEKIFKAPLLRQHLNVHTGEKPFGCPDCPAHFSLKSTLVCHQRSQHWEKKHACPQCPFQSSRRAKLRDHMMIHEDRKRDFTCDICAASFYTSSGLSNHMVLHSEDKGKRHACPYEGCNRSFRSPSEVVYHSRIHTGDKPFLCDTCGYSARSRHQLTKHERSHNGIKPFKCNFCSYSSTHSAQLRRHMRVHTRIKPYMCPHCNYTSNTCENLRKHVLKSKKHSGLSVYPCQHCQFGCNMASEMRDHVIAEHPDVAKQFDPESPAFASLVTGIYNQKGDIRAPIDTPAPYVPRTELRDMNKNLHSKLRAKLVDRDVMVEMDDSNGQLEGNDENGPYLRVVLEEDTTQKVAAEKNEVSSAVEYLMKSNKRKAQLKKPTFRPSKKVKTYVNNAARLSSPALKNDGSQLYHLLSEDSTVIEGDREEGDEAQTELATYIIELPNEQAAEHVVMSDEQEEETELKITDIVGDQQLEYGPDTVIQTMTGTTADGETVIFYMNIA